MMLAIYRGSQSSKNRLVSSWLAESLFSKARLFSWKETLLI